ncbi:MAG: hypothetical protein SEPTF4163_006674, partial [Sporothrix epigloea]
MAPELRSSTEKKAPEPAESSTSQGQATASGSSSTGTTATSQHESLRDFMEFLMRRDEDERKRQEQRDEDERKRQERRDEAFYQTQQQLTSAIMSLAASLTGQTPIVPRPESVAPAHPATTETVVPAATVVPSEQADLSCSADSMAVETITLVAFHAEA